MITLERRYQSSGAIGRKLINCGVKYTAALAAALAALAPLVANATEGGGSIYPIGVNTILAGFMPSPGDYAYLYGARYDSNHTLDGSGNDKAGINNFGAHVNALAFRYDHVWDGVTFLGANLMTRIGVPFVDLHLHFDVKTPKGIVHKDSSDTGLSDAAIIPLALGWHSPHLNQMVGIEFFLPTGDYDVHRLANVGRHYYSISPEYFFTLKPIDKVEISAKVMYLFNTTNHETNYSSGDELIIDYNLGYQVTPKLQVGANGYFYKQTTNDVQNGAIVNGGNEGRVLSAGPFIKYQPTRSLALVFKWQHEMLVENRTRGDRFWLQVAYKFR
ncbi:hypothetical protein F4827_004693 [Paraburkholderia bannensis]|uniref:Phenol degradation protein meta n=1 Tax=Paraburkholderia bannensis TaxID=765414 RepID=A0A7W9U0M7_9BURK|nr:MULTISPECIES: transporter [Paraburkholderia]MBB3259862.1 hypothetical protein [Paraburkholderia sp. WP4_3_2]MBB6104828.1 hypothetical protein [Paraburkholderia bannensis]